MTLKEFKERIKESDNREWLNAVEITIHLNACNFYQEFRGVEKLYAFLVRESNAWQKELNENNVSALESSYKWFLDKKERLTSIVSDGYASEYARNRLVDELKTSEAVFTANSPEAQFLIQLWKLNSGYVEGAFNFFIGKLRHPNWTDNKNLMAGVLAAYEFNRKDLTTVVNRGEAELKEFNQLRTGFQKEIDEAHDARTALFKELEESKKEFNNTIKQAQQDFEDNYNEWITSHQEKGASHHEDSVTKINELESTYANLLMLEKPAEYWDKRAEELKISANKWLWWAGGSATVGLIVFMILIFSLFGENLYDQIKNPAISIRWSIISAVSILLFVFLVRTFVKLAMSTYHLYRDAQERKQLTYLYLSLKKESDIPDADRHIILQSLFSRADTGLLKEDSSPTMPSGVLEKIVGK